MLPKHCFDVAGDFWAQTHCEHRNQHRKEPWIPEKKLDFFVTNFRWTHKYVNCRGWQYWQTKPVLREYKVSNLISWSSFDMWYDVHISWNMKKRTSSWNFISNEMADVKLVRNNKIKIIDDGRSLTLPSFHKCFHFFFSVHQLLIDESALLIVHSLEALKMLKISDFVDWTHYWLIFNFHVFFFSLQPVINDFNSFDMLLFTFKRLYYLRDALQLNAVSFILSVRWYKTNGFEWNIYSSTNQTESVIVVDL